MPLHDILIKQLKSLNYPINKKGICYGIAFMGMQAILAEDINSFNSRINTLFHLSNLKETLKQAMAARIARNEKIKSALQQELEIKLESKKNYNRKAVSEKQQNETEKQRFSDAELNRRIETADKKLSQKEQNILTVPAFFEGVAIYCAPFEFPYLFEEKYSIKSQNGALTLVYALPKNLIVEEKGEEERKDGSKIQFIREVPNVEKVDSFDMSGVYNIKELRSYFQILRQNLLDQKSALDCPVAFVLNSGTHAITVGFDPKKKKWILIDANQLPAKMISSNKEIASMVMNAFSINNTAIFSTEMYVKKSQLDKAVKCVKLWKKDSEWKKIHALTENKVILKNSDNLTWLHIAVEANQYSLVEKLLEKNNININAVGKDGLTPLYIAVKKRYLPLVEKLIEQDEINVNAATEETGATSLYIAAQNNQLIIVDKLLKKKNININANVKNGATPLYIAADQGHLNIIETLLKQKDIRINKACLDGTTPLWIAVQNNHDTVVEKFLEREDIDINACRKGVTALLMAVKNANFRIIEKLLKQNEIAVNKANENGVTPLYMAAQNGQLVIVKKLLEHKAEVNAGIVSGATPLYIAAQEGYENIVKRILEQKNIDVNKARVNGETPLHISIKNGHYNITKKLLDHPSINPDLIYKAPISELLKSAKNKNRIAHMRTLFAKKNIVNFVELNALHLAVFCGQPEIISLLIKSGLDTNKSTKGNISALELAEAMGDSNVIKMLSASIQYKKPVEKSISNTLINANLYNKIMLELDNYISEKSKKLNRCCLFSCFHNAGLTEAKLNIAMLLKEDIFMTPNMLELNTLIKKSSERYHALGYRPLFTSHFKTCLTRIENMIKENDHKNQTDSISNAFIPIHRKKTGVI